MNTFKITNYNDFRVWLVATCLTKIAREEA